MTPREIAAALNLVAHEEGGYYRQTFQTELTLELPDRDGVTRYVLNTILYMLTDVSPVNFLHRNRSAIVHYYHQGAPLEYTVLWPDGRLESQTLGPDIAAGHVLQLVVPGGCWKAARLLGGPYGLISEAVAPGWDIRDRELATHALLEQFPTHAARLSGLILKES